MALICWQNLRPAIRCVQFYVPRMKTIYPCALLWLALSLPLFAYEFTDLQGRKLNAEIVSADAGQVTLKRAPDGRVFSVPVTTFSAADQKHIADWARANVRYDFRVEHTTKKIKEEKKKEQSGEALDIHEYETWIYQIKITSRMKTALSDLRADYWCFRDEELPPPSTKRPRRAGETEAEWRKPEKRLAFVSGSAEIKSLPAAGSMAVDAKEVVLHKVKKGTTSMGKFGVDTADRLAGFVLRIFDKEGKEVFKMATKDDLFSQTSASTSTPPKTTNR